MKKYKLIACNVFQRELCHLLSSTRNLVDPEFLELGLHETPGILRESLQARIDAASSATPAGQGYDAILLAYGLCGTGLAGIQARSLPLILPRAHDCCTILLGSRAAYIEHFGDNPSASWSSSGYIERGTTYFRSTVLGQSTGIGMEYADLVEKYGEENAAFVWETLHPELHETVLRYIEVPETAHLGYEETMQARAAEEGKDFLKIPGSMRLLAALLRGEVDEASFNEEFLVVPPGGVIESAWDNEKIVQVGKREERSE